MSGRLRGRMRSTSGRCWLREHVAILEAEQQAVVESVERLRVAKTRAAMLPALELRLISLLAAQRELLEHLAAEHGSGRARPRRREAA